MSAPHRYTIIIPPETLRRAKEYRDELLQGRMRPGHWLDEVLRSCNSLSEISSIDLLGFLFDTKRPSIFAESEVLGDGSDWNLVELGLLGDVSIAAPVIIFDNGDHDDPTPHYPPFSGALVFTPGALLRNDQGFTPADWNEVTDRNGNFSEAGYYRLYKRRLLPVLRYINAQVTRPRSAFVTVPGLGCGQFAGPFSGKLGPRLKEVLATLLDEHGAELPNLRALYFDPYSGSENERREIQGISFFCRPLQVPGNEGKNQLCHPSAYEDPGDDFSDCELYSIVAWDHVSWPGNDFFRGARLTDDGVKAAATSAMLAITGVEGSYDPARGMYRPPEPYTTWNEVVAEGQASNTLRLWDYEDLPAS